MGGNYVSVYYFNDLNEISEISPSIDIEFNLPNSLQFQVMGILEDLNGSVVTISDIPDIYEFQVTEGLPNQSGTTSMIYTIPRGINSNEEIFINYWIVPNGGENLRNFSVNSQDYETEYETFSFIYNGPVYTPVSNGMVGDTLSLKKQ